MRVLAPPSLKSFLLNPHALELRRTGYSTTVWTNHYNGIYAAKYTTRFRAGPTNAQLRNIRKEKTTMININGSLQGISCQLPLLPSSVSRLFLGKAYLDIETQTLRVSPKGLEVVLV